MEQNFQKLKRKYLYISIIKSVLSGLAACALVVGVLLLTLKLTGVKINAGYYVLIGVAVAAAAGGLTFLFTRPTDKSVAKQLDGDHGLNEKVQTMVAFRGEEGTILSLQREDTESVLAGVSVKRPALKRILIGAAVALVSLAMFISAVSVPARYAEGADDYEISRLQAVALQQLIDDVKKSDLKEDDKGASVVVLESLLDGLQNTVQDSVMRTAVLSSITMIDGILADGNSYIKISADLRKADSEHVKALAGAIASGGVFYRKLNVKPDSLSKINEIAQDADEVLAEIITNGLSALRTEYKELSGLTLSVEITKFTLPCADALSGNADEDDGLYKALTAYNSQLSEISKRSSGSGYTPAAIQEQLDEAFNKLSQDGGAALADQAYNCMMDEFIRNRLASIFGIGAPALPNKEETETSSPSDDPGGDKNPDGTHSGGGGDKNVNFGSNDLVYSPADDDIVRYKEVIDAYYASINERIDGGEISEELKDYIEKYFAILFSGIQEDKAEN